MNRFLYAQVARVQSNKSLSSTSSFEKMLAVWASTDFHAIHNLNPSTRRRLTPGSRPAFEVQARR
jgi:hypothetical protein